MRSVRWPNGIEYTGADSHWERLAVSATPVPPFALFEFVASQVSNALQANNAKSGTLRVDARSAKRLR